MTDRIYVTYTPTTAPGSYHAAVHYERTDPAGNVVKHVVIEAQPEKLEQLSASDKASGVVEEAFREDDGPSRFGRIDAYVRENTGSDPNAPYEIIAEGDDLSANLARMQLFAHGVNRAGLAYRGHHQNSNSFASGALQAGELPSATGVAHDPAGPPGELLGFFAPGLNQPLRAPIGLSREMVDAARDTFDNRVGKWGSSPARIAPLLPSDRPDSLSNRFGNWGTVPADHFGDNSSPVLRGLQRRSAVPDGPASASAAPATPAFQQNAVYSTTGDFYGPGASAIAAAPSPLAFNDSGVGPGTRTDVYALAQGIRRLMSDVGQSMWNGLPSPAQAALLSRPPLPGQAAPDLAGGETQRDPSNVPERRLARIIVNPSAGGPGDARSSPVPQPQDSQGPLSLEEAYRLYLAKLNANKPQASTPDPAAPFDASYGNPPGFSAADWIASLAGVDRQNPAQPALSPQTRGFAGSPYGGNPIQSWGDAPEYAGGLLNSIDLASLDPQNPNQPAPPPTDNEQDQAKLQALEDNLTSTGDIRDAVVLYNARKASRARGAVDQA